MAKRITKYLIYIFVCALALFALFCTPSVNIKALAEETQESTVIDVKTCDLNNGGGDYNGMEYSLKASFSPNVTVAYFDNSRKDAGATMVTAVFTPKEGYTFSNGQATYTLTAMINIMPREIDAKFIVPTNMIEDGTEYEIKAIPQGEVVGDIINFEYSGNKSKLGGYHKATIIGIDNPNYRLPNAVPFVYYTIFSNRLYSTCDGEQNGLGALEMDEFVGEGYNQTFVIKDIFQSAEVFSFPENKAKEAYYFLSFSDETRDSYNVWIKTAATEQKRTGYMVLYIDNQKTKEITPLEQDGYLKFTVAKLGEFAVVYDKQGDVDISGGGGDDGDGSGGGIGSGNNFVMPWWFWIVVVIASLLLIMFTIFLLQTRGLIVIPFLRNIQHTLSFESNGGTDIDDEQYGIGAMILDLEEKIPTLAGYEFDGWYSDVELRKPFIKKRMPAKNIKLYAKWI